MRWRCRLLTASLQRELLGVPVPRVGNHPPFDDSSGGEAVRFAADHGLRLMPWQEHALHVMLGERAGSQWAAREVGMLVARQNGKGVVLMVRELAGLLVFGEDQVLHSAHQVRTSLEHFRRVKQFIRDSPKLEKLVKRISDKNGDEAVEFRSGARLQFMSRSKSSGRGFSPQCIVMDEAQEMPESSVDALAPTLLAQRDAQFIYAGTVPAQVNDCAHFTRVRDRGRAGGDPNLAWLEWSPEPDMRVEDQRAVAMANPSLGHPNGLSWESVEWLRSTLGPDGFARESLSMWNDQGHLSLVDPDVWGNLADPASMPVDPVALSIAVSPERVACIGVAGARADGLIHLDYGHDLRRGLSWVPEKVAELVGKRRTCAVVLDPAGLAGALIPDLIELGVKPISVTSRELAQSCGMVLENVEAGKVRHLGQPPLAVALDRARTRKVQEAWVWDRPDSSVDVAPLFAVSLALFGFLKFGRTVPKSYEVFEF